MHDKTIRRRRAVLALLVAVSLILLTDYFGESPSSPLHSVQRGIVAVLSPIQDGASKVLSPVRDVTNWFSSTLKAKSELANAQKENQKYVNQLAHDRYDAIEYAQAQGLLKLDNVDNLKQYGLLAASVTGRDPLLWYETITVNKGSSSGVALRDPVIGDAGLVGDVTTVDSSYSIVTLITSPKIGGVGAMVENAAGDSGTLQPDAGNPSNLVLSELPTSAQISFGQEVVTSGFKDTADPTIESLYPGGIPIGQVSNQIPGNSVVTNHQVDVTPAVDFTHLSVVQILTHADRQS